MAQAFGNKEPSTLRSLLAGKPSTVATPDTSLLDAGVLIAEHRKAALVVEDGNSIGIVGFKDMMTRAVAKEMPLELTAVTKMMTPNPDSVHPDITVLEALQVMHDNKFLTLLVCENDRRDVGLVTAMDVIYMAVVERKGGDHCSAARWIWTTFPTQLLFTAGSGVPQGTSSAARSTRSKSSVVERLQDDFRLSRWLSIVFLV